MSNSKANPDKQRRRGFAALTQERLREIASLGGKAAHQLGRAHQFTPEEARAAGRKGGIGSIGRSFQPRCGICRQPDHNRRTCASMARAS